MPAKIQAFNQELLIKFRFKELFNELGWDSPAQQQPYTVAIGDDDWLLDVVAHKKGVQVLQCRPYADGRLPDYATRQKIERKITVDVREHLIVFTDTAQTTQIWQWVARLQGKTAQYREVNFRKGEAPELLTQKLNRLHFTLDEEELLTVLGVAQRLDDAAPREKVTKKFYGEFEKQRKAFAEFIDGIPLTGKDISEDQRWYTAVLIDRLMFLWFLQEKSFLDGKKDYLQSRLAGHLDAKRDVSFYKSFLAPLFFRGFAEERTAANRTSIEAAFGNVPYLNGGLFAQHQLEQRYGEALDVADAAFVKLFAFFDDWEWHLDERPLKSGNEINPDVLGYIFEKFVNQKQMGAYYTKEDITDYIGKNTIIPCLLAKVRAEHPASFDALVWPLLQQSGDAYIYPAMLKGVDIAYPADISNGLDTESPDLLARRKPWNKRADDAASLPTEIWRETIARHQRTREVRSKLASGELRDVGDLITYNLDIRQFAQDLIERCTDVALLKSFWFALAGRLPRNNTDRFRHGLSVLDPTCGSGAFLFAALNILKPLYDATLRTLQAVRSDALIAGDPPQPEKWDEVDDLLTRFSAARSERDQDYAVIKHIIVNNLYGVDIEEQATEIAKLRLFLKLVALLEPGDDIEPLPDIDFNIRHGNTLVGYATADETEKAVKGATQGNLLFSDAWEDIRIRLSEVEVKYNNFQIQQVQRGGHVPPSDKLELEDKLDELEELLNYHLAREYGINTTKPREYEAWKLSHHPFHWYVDFYPLMAAGGFDAVIGNPPYIATSKIRANYNVKGYLTAQASDIYAWCLERITNLVSERGSTGMIVPLSLGFSRDFSVLRELLGNRYQTNWYSSYARIPAALFAADVRVRNMIHIGLKSASQAKITHTTRLHRWFEEYRPNLMTTISYSRCQPGLWKGRIPKLGTQTIIDTFESLLKSKARVSDAFSSTPSAHSLSFKKSAYNWLSFGREQALCFDAAGREIPQTEYGMTYFQNANSAAAGILLFNGKLELAYWVAIGDDFHVTNWMFDEFPADLDEIAKRWGNTLSTDADNLWTAMLGATSFKLNAGKRVGNFNLSQLRDRTNISDYRLCNLLGIEAAWQEIELLYVQTVKTTTTAEQDD
jgi:hypothetical protein